MFGRHAHAQREREREGVSERNPCQPKLRLSGARIGAKAPLTFAHCGQNFIVAMAAVRSPLAKTPCFALGAVPPPLLGTGPEFRSGWPSFARRDALPGTPPPRLPRRPASLSTSAAHSLRTPPSDRAVPAPRRLPLRPSARAPPPKADASFHFFGGQLFKEKSQKSQACGIPHDGTLIRKIFGIITRAAENNRVETQKGAPPGVIIFAGILGHGHEKAGAGFDNRHGGERRRDHGDAKDEDRAVRR